MDIFPMIKIVVVANSNSVSFGFLLVQNVKFACIRPSVPCNKRKKNFGGSFSENKTKNKKFDIVVSDNNVNDEIKKETRKKLTADYKWLRKVYREVVKTTHPESPP